MHFVVILFLAQLVGALAAVLYLPSLPDHLFPEIALAVCGYAGMVALVFVTYVLIGSDGEGAAQPRQDSAFPVSCEAGAELNDQERQSARFFAHEFCLRHFGLTHSVMLSVPKDSRWIPPSMRRP